MKKLPAGILENLQFLCVEIDSQVSTLSHYLSSPSPSLGRKIRDRAGYAYNLKTRIHTATVNVIASGVKQSKDKFTLRCIEFIATDLERIAEVCRHCVLQSEQLDDYRLLTDEALITILKKVRQAIELVMPAVTERKSDTAIKIEHINEQMRSTHQRLMKRYTLELKKGSQVKQITQAMFVAYEMKQFGDALSRISETIISSNLGQPINFERYYSLQSLIDGVDDVDDEIAITPIAETRSGSAISGLAKPSNNGDFLAIYKDGQKRKLKEEKQGLNSWHEIYPGLAPKILSYKKKGESAALLIEHLTGYTFEQIIVNEPEAVQQQALKQLKKTLNSVWTETRRKKMAPAHFMQQLKKRLGEVYKIHPEFDVGSSSIGSHAVTAMSDLIEQAQHREKDWLPPFSVYIHGDFNVDNIIYDPVDKRVNFIDLHRSCYADYVQDVAIFMVSNYRLQIMDKVRRRQIMAAAIDMYGMARRFARKNSDESFELRLALGMARAFITSTRFILDKALAKRMFYRGQYLIGLVLAVEAGKENKFTVPVKEMFVE